MNCFECEQYTGGIDWNSCGVTGAENFQTIKDCNFVNDDGTINYNDDFFRGSTNTVVLPCYPGTHVIVQTEFGPREDIVLGFVLNTTGSFAKIRGIGLVPLNKFAETAQIVEVPDDK